MNTIPFTDIIAVTGCDYCGSAATYNCVTASGGECEYPHKVRTERGRSIIRQQAAAARQADPRIEVRVAALEAGLKAALQALNLMASTIDNLVEVAEITTDRCNDLEALSSTFRTALLKQSVQMVLDGMDSGEPAFEDVWEVDEWRLGEPLRLRVEDVVLP